MKFAVTSLLIVSLGCPSAFATPTNLTTDQLDVLGEARAQGDNFAWAVLTKFVLGQPRSVVLMGEGPTILPGDTFIAKRVIDRFEHFAVDDSNVRSSCGRCPRISDPNSPVNLTPFGARVKSIERFDEPRPRARSQIVQGGVMTTALVSALVSLSYFMYGVPVRQFRSPTTLAMAGLLAGSLTIVGAQSSCPTCFPIGRSKVSSMATFIDQWVTAQGAEGPLVAVIQRHFVENVREILKTRFAFEVN